MGRIKSAGWYVEVMAHWKSLATEKLGGRGDSLLLVWGVLEEMEVKRVITMRGKMLKYRCS